MDPDTRQARIVAVDVPSLSDSVIIQKRLAGSVTYNGRRMNGSVSFFNDRRDISLGGDETTYGVTASLGRTLSRRAKASVTGGMQDSSFASGDTRTQWNVGVRLDYTLNADLQVAVSADRQSSDSSLAGGDFVENRINMNARMSF